MPLVGVQNSRSGIGPGTGTNTKASGRYATAFGYGTQASGTSSTASGSFTAASGSTRLRLWKARSGVRNSSAPSRKNGRFSSKNSGKRWFAVLWGGIAIAVTLVLVITIVGILIAWLPVLVVGAWLIYRVARGWLALKGGKPVSPALSNPPGP